MALTPEQEALNFNPELQDVSRQRKLAEALMAQGLQQPPQGQMISGRYVAPSWTQMLNPMANTLAGQAVANRADTQEQQLATALRGKYAQDVQTYAELQKTDPAKAIQFGLTSQNPTLKALVAEDLKTVKYGEGEIGQRKNIATGELETVGRGGEKLHSVDGNLVDSKGNLVFKAPKQYAPHASQLVPVQGGFAEYNSNTRTLTPIGGAGGGATGSPTGALMPPLPQHLQTEMASINQQKASINDALKTVEANKDAFGPKFAAPGLIAGEFGTSRMNEKMPSSQVEARAKVFNIASSLIKERAGTAQSKQEQEIIMRFLPSPYDGEKAITDKFNAFNDYLTSKEKGMTAAVGAVPAYRPTPTETPKQETPGSWGKAVVVTESK
jgi:hypothetical protein